VSSVVKGGGGQVERKEARRAVRKDSLENGLAKGKMTTKARKKKEESVAERFLARTTRLLREKVGRIQKGQ